MFPDSSVLVDLGHAVGYSDAIHLIGKRVCSVKDQRRLMSKSSMDLLESICRLAFRTIIAEGGK